MNKNCILFSICFILFIGTICISNNIIQNKKENIMTLPYSTEDSSMPKKSQLSVVKHNNPSSESEKKISMMLTQKNYSSSTKKMNVIIKNNTLDEYSTDMKYSIEYFHGSTWVKVPLDIVVNYVEILLSPKKSKELSVYLYPEQYCYKSGKYRICKTVYLTKDKCLITSEFNIK